MANITELSEKITIGALVVCLSATGVYVEQVLAGQPAKGNIIVTVTGINSDQGTIKIGLFNKQAGFMDAKHAVHSLNKAVKKGSVIGSFNNLPCGGYAFSVVHDENNNGHLDNNFLGMLKEGYAFCRNVRPRFSASSFKTTKILLNDKTKNIRIRMRH